MIDSFIAYIERLELLTFFSGYPLVYTFVHFIAGSKPGTAKSFFIHDAMPSLPKAYALSGSIFFLLWIREMIIQSGIPNMAPGFDITPLKIWALLACFFWIPVLARRPLSVCSTAWFFLSYSLKTL